MLKFRLCGKLSVFKELLWPVLWLWLPPHPGDGGSPRFLCGLLLHVYSTPIPTPLHSAPSVLHQTQLDGSGENLVRGKGFSFLLYFFSSF